MTTPQPGIVMEENTDSVFLVLSARAGADRRALIRAAASAPAEAERLAKTDPAAALCCTVAFGRSLLEHAAGWPAMPPRFADLEPIHGSAGTVPCTAADVLFHISSSRRDLNFELAQRLLAATAGHADIVEEISGFRYLDTRDLTGFKDGTANPQGDERADVALFGADDGGFESSSCVLIMRFVHDLAAWSRLDVASQEAVVGRTKADSIELAEGKKLPTAHISRVEIDGPDGEELKIVRHSMPYGAAGGEKGLFFIAYAKDSAIFQTMLAHMFGAAGDGLSDRLMAFTKPVTGAILFAPSRQTLAQLSRL